MKHTFGAFTWSSSLLGFAGKLKSAALDKCISPTGTLQILVSSKLSESECRLDPLQTLSLEVFLQNQESIRIEA